MFSINRREFIRKTSYSDLHFGLDDAVTHTKSFARAMKDRDSSIKLIGWGDVPDAGIFREEQNSEQNRFWAEKFMKLHQMIRGLM